MNKFISIVSPVYKAEEIVHELVEQITNCMKEITTDFEIVLVEDGSPDNSWSEIEKICEVNKHVKGIKLSRNFGQHKAISAGLENAKGDWIVVMDCDLQDRPQEIINLYNKATEGYDIVLAQRKTRNDSFFKRLSSKLFYKTFAYLTGIPQDESVANFGIYSRKVINALNSMRETARAFPIMIKWVGFSKTHIEVTHAERFTGKSSYDFKRLINLALDIIVSYSDKPLRLTIKIGFFISLFSILFAMYNLIAYLTGYIKVTGYASLIVSIWFLSGLIIFIIGIVGLYIGKTFDGVKRRPIYIIDKHLNE